MRPSLKRSALLISGFLAVSMPVRAAEPTEAQILYWGPRVDVAELPRLLVEVTAGPKEHWPAVLSKPAASRLEPTARSNQAAFRGIAVRLAQSLAEHGTSLPSLTDAKFAASATALLAMRDEIARRPSYVNYVLADEINRILIVEVGKRIVQQNLSPDVAALVAPLGSYEVRLDELADTAQQELGGSVLSPTVRDGSDDAAKFKSLWATFAPGGLFPAAPTLGSARTSKMLDGQFFELILLRYVGTDGYIHAALPRTLQYRSVVGDYSPQDDFRKILAATQGQKTVPTLSERVTGRELGFHSVSFLLHDVDTGNLEAKMLSRRVEP